MKHFNQEIYNLVLKAGGTVVDDIVKFSKIEFENFMVEFVEYVQKRQEVIRTDALEGFTYMGDDVPSSIIIREVFNSISDQYKV